MKMNFNDFWIDNKRFLITVGGALVVFFLVGQFARGYVDDAESIGNKSRRERRDIIALHKNLKNSYWLELAKVSEYEEQEAALEGALGMPESKEVDGQNEDDLRVKFDQAISRVWQELRSKASPIGLKMPPVVTSEEDFGADPEHGIEAYRIFYSYLRVLRLALRAIIEARVTEMEAPEILAPDYLPVKENADELVCLFHGVSIPVTGSYDSLMRVLAAVQKPGEFLQARLKNVKTVKSRNSEARLLRGDIEFYGFAMVEPIEEEDTSNRSRRGGRRRRR